MSLSRNVLARIAGLLYLVVAITGGFAELVVRTNVKVPGDVAATAEKIRESATLFRVGFVSDLVDIGVFLAVGLLLYVLLSPVSRRAAATFLIMNVLAVGMMGVNMLNHIAALILATDPSYANALGAPSADAFASLFLALHHQGYLIAQIFFGGWLLPLGYAVYKSGFIPRAIGAFLMIGAFGYLAELAILYGSPSFESGFALSLAMIGGLSEIALLLWLIARGARPEPENVAPLSSPAQRAATTA